MSKKNYCNDKVDCNCGTAHLDHPAVSCTLLLMTEARSTVFQH
jgi:hypothetical protein